MMAKLGPFWRRDSCWMERGVLERLITHLSAGALHVCGLGGVATDRVILCRGMECSGGGR